MSQSNVPMLRVLLDLWIVIVATDEPLGIEDGILRIGMKRVLRAVAHTGRKCKVSGYFGLNIGADLQSLAIREAHPRGSYPVTLVVRDDLNPAASHHPDT